MRTRGCVDLDVGDGCAVGVKFVPAVACPVDGEEERARRNQVTPPTTATPAAAIPVTNTARREIPRGVDSVWLSNACWLPMEGEPTSLAGASCCVPIAGTFASPGEEKTLSGGWAGAFMLKTGSGDCAIRVLAGVFNTVGGSGGCASCLIAGWFNLVGCSGGCI